MRQALEQGAKTQQADDRIEFESPLCFHNKPHPVAQVRRDAHVGKQPRLLKDIPEPALLRRQVHARFGIEQGPPGDGDAPPVGTRKARDHIHDHGLARAGRTEQGRHPGGGAELGGKLKARNAALDVDLDHAVPRNRREIRRDKISDAIRAANATAMEMTTRRITASSVPGT